MKITGQKTFSTEGSSIVSTVELNLVYSEIPEDFICVIANFLVSLGFNAKFIAEGIRAVGDQREGITQLSRIRLLPYAIEGLENAVKNTTDKKEKANLELILGWTKDELNPPKE